MKFLVNKSLYLSKGEIVPRLLLIYDPVTDCVVDLGVMYDNHLSFSPHINKIVNNASRRANLILRCFTTRDPLVLMKAFNTFVRPIVEYALCNCCLEPVCKNVNKKN